MSEIPYTVINDFIVACGYKPVDVLGFDVTPNGVNWAFTVTDAQGNVQHGLERHIIDTIQRTAAQPVGRNILLTVNEQVGVQSSASGETNPPN